MAKSAAAEETIPPPPTIVYLGNRNAIERIGEGDDEERRPLPGKRCTTVILPGGLTLMEAAREITSPQGVWAAHSDATAPAWIAAAGPLAEPLAQILAAQWPGIEIREPDPDQEG